jgi:hypothetical protein
VKALALLLPFALSAQTPLALTTWHSDGSLFGGSVRVSYANEAFRTVQAGQIRATSPGESWITYCTDLNNVLAAGLFSPIPLPLANDPAHQNPDWVPGGIVRATQAVVFYGGQINTAREAVALQAMVWELLYDTSPDLASGSFRAQDGAVSGATSLTSLWLQQSEWTQVDTSAAQWFQPVNYLGEYREAQGLIGHVPEPGTWGAIGVGLVAVGWVAVKRRVA